MKKVPIALLATFLAISPVFIGCKSKKAETNKTTDQPATTDNQPAVEPVVTSTDDELTRSVTDALKDHPSVHYSLDNGKIVLT
jgi:hypothetical protein